MRHEDIWNITGEGEEYSPVYVHFVKDMAETEALECKFLEETETLSVLFISVPRTFHI